MVINSRPQRSISVKAARQIANRKARHRPRPTVPRKQKTYKPKPKPSKSQTKLAKLCKDILVGAPSYRQEATWSWLVSSKGANMYLDILFPELKLALEYQGPHHTKLGRYMKTEEKLREQQARDKLKLKLLKERGYTVVIWPYTRYLSRRAVYNTLLELGFEVKMPPRAKPKTQRGKKIKRPRMKYLKPLIRRQIK